MSSQASVSNDNQVVKSLFSALRTSIPQDVRLELARASSDELKFLIAIQPRVCSFAHRRRHSLRHPALAMATKRFYCYRRKRRALELQHCRSKGRAQAARHADGGGGGDEAHSSSDDNESYYYGGDVEATESVWGKSSQSLRRPSRGDLDAMTEDDDGWSEFGMSMSSAVWNYRRMSHSAGLAADWAMLGPSRRVSVGTASATSEALTVLRGAPPLMRLMERPSDAGIDRSISQFFSNHPSTQHSHPSPPRRRRSASLRRRVKSRLSRRPSSAGSTVSARGGGVSAEALDMAMAGLPSQGRRRANIQSGHELMDEDEEEEYLLFQQNEDNRWSQLAYCYDQMLRGASKSVKVAALTAGLNAIVNDIIFRFWDRMTVSPAAQEAYRRSGMADNAARRTGSVARAGAKDSSPQDGDGKDGAGNGNGDTGAAASSSGRRQQRKGVGGRKAVATVTKASPATGGARAKKSGRSKNSAASSGLPSSSASGNKCETKTKGASRAATPPEILDGPADGSPQQRRSAADGSDDDEQRQLEKAHYDRSPLDQSISVPNADDSVLSFGDVPYDEDGDASLGVGLLTADANKTGRRRSRRIVLPATALYMTPLQYTYLNCRIASVLLPESQELEVEMLQSVQEDLVADARFQDADPNHDSFFGPPPHFVPAGSGSPMYSRRQSRREGSGLRSASADRRHAGQGSGDWQGDTDSVADGSIAAFTVDGELPASSGAVMPWDAGKLPSLTYGQFWRSMMELADNWTFSAAHPSEFAVFLLELYGVVFGHEWDEDDQQLVETLRLSVADYLDDKELQQNAEAALDSFHNMVHELDQLSSSDDDSSDDRASASGGSKGGGRRRRRTKRPGQGNSVSSIELLEGSVIKTISSVLSRDDWKYGQLVGLDGTMVTFRRRATYQMSNRRKYREAFQLACGENVDELSPHSSDFSVYIIEEQLNANGQVIRRRRLHRHGTHKRGRHSTSSGHDAGEDEEAEDEEGEEDGADGDALSDDEFMYEEVEGADGSRFRSRRYYDEPPRKLRRLEGGVRKDDNEDCYDDNLSLTGSWSSFTDASLSDVGGLKFPVFGSEDVGSDTGGDPSTSRPPHRKRRRARVRRTGKRSEQRRYGRGADYYYHGSKPNGGKRDGGRGRRGKNKGSRGAGSQDEGASSSLRSITDDSFMGDFSHSTQSDEEVTPPTPKSGRPSDANVPPQTAATLTDEQRRELQEKRAWLQAVLAAKGIHVADSAFADADEEGVLYELLKLAERWERRKQAGGGGDEDDDLGSAEFNAALLASLFAKPHAYTIDELQRTELMEKLLAMGEDGEQKIALTSDQMGSVLQALMNRGGGDKVIETTSMRLRRERLIAEARRLQKELAAAEKRKRHEERDERHRLAREAVAAAADAADKEGRDTFDLTKVDADKSPPPTRPPRPDTEWHDPTAGDDGPLELSRGVSAASRGKPPVKLPPSALQPSQGGSGDGGVFLPLPPPALDPLTRAQRKEQNRLFKEFEAYTEAQASRGGRYKTSFTEYTPEQFEAFFRHLHLGPQEQALLLGRAPLAASSSLQSGAYGQLQPALPPASGAGDGTARLRGRYGFLLGSTAVTASKSAGPASSCAGGHEIRPAAVKLFTLTTSRSLAGAIKESYRSYLEDRTFQESSLRAKGGKGVTAGPLLPSLPPSPPPPPSRAMGRHARGPADVTDWRTSAAPAATAESNAGAALHPVSVPQASASASSPSPPLFDRSAKMPPLLNRKQLGSASSAGSRGEKPLPA